MVIPENLRIICKKNFVYIFIIKFNFSADSGKLLRKNSDVLEHEIFVLEVLFVDNKVFDVILIVLQSMADQDCEVSFALTKFYVQNFILYPLFVKSNINLYSIYDF